MHALALLLSLTLGQLNCQNGQCSVAQAPTPALSAPTALPGHHIEYRTETRYRTETQYQTQQRCNGGSCSLVQVPVSVSVPYQASIAYSIPNAPAAATKQPAPGRSTPSPIFSTPKCCPDCTCKCGNCCKASNSVSFLPR